MPFESPQHDLSDLMKNIGTRKIQLPDFQREWKWDDDRIVSLLASISMGYPIGVLMALDVGGDVNFAAKPLAGVDEENAVAAPERLLLDGQQRMTSLFQALVSDQPVNTRDQRGKPVKRWYYLDINKALTNPSDREEAILSVPEDRIVRGDFGRRIVHDLSTLDGECKSDMFPLNRVFDVSFKDAWTFHYLQIDPIGTHERMSRLSRFKEEVLTHFERYKIPVIVLTKDTPREAVCTVFEKVNTGGVPLDVFELLTATFASEGFNLKNDWDKHWDRLRRKDVLGNLKSSDFLQAVSLVATWDRKRNWPGAKSDAPGVSCKRRDILRFMLDEYARWAGRVAEGFEWAATFLAEEGISDARNLPYRTQLVPLAAVRVVLGTDIDNHGTIKRIRQWFWCGVLGEQYGGAIETRIARDLEQIIDWIKHDDEAPGTVTTASFNSSRLLTLKTRNSAAYKGIYALLMRNGCLDWQKHKTLSKESSRGFQIDIHHIFPKSWCNKHGINDNHRESIVNKTAISSDTNRGIGGRAPSDYLSTLEKKAGISADHLDEILATHAIDASTLREDDFNRFFGHRKRQLIKTIEHAMGKPVNIDDENTQAETPS